MFYGIASLREIIPYGAFIPQVQTYSDQLRIFNPIGDWGFVVHDDSQYKIGGILHNLGILVGCLLYLGKKVIAFFASRRDWTLRDICSLVRITAHACSWINYLTFLLQSMIMYGLVAVLFKKESWFIYWHTQVFVSDIRYM